MQYTTIALALAGSALANPLFARDEQCAADSCLAAVTGTGALWDAGLRASHCASYLITTVTPAPVVVTTTITESESTAAWETYAANSVTVCPHQVPKYASACGTDAYASACGCFGQGTAAVTTLATPTTTQTVYVRPTGTGGSWPSKCLSDADAQYFVDSFVDLLEHTNYDGHLGGPKGSGFNTDLANKILAPTFQDISDSINILAGIPLGSVTFDGRDAFIAGQGSQPEVSVTVAKIWHNCDTITFRYSLLTGDGANLPVVGINVQELTSDLSQIQTQYAEFNSAAWLVDLGNPECKSNGTSSSRHRL